MMNRLDVRQEDFIHDPLWFHKRNLQQTASGYGRSLKTEYKVRYNNRLHRVYCCCFSNTGTLYIKTKSGDRIINEV